MPRLLELDTYTLQANQQMLVEELATLLAEETAEVSVAVTEHLLLQTGLYAIALASFPDTAELSMIEQLVAAVQKRHREHAETERHTTLKYSIALAPSFELIDSLPAHHPIRAWWDLARPNLHNMNRIRDWYATDVIRTQARNLPLLDAVGTDAHRELAELKDAAPESELGRQSISSARSGKPALCKHDCRPTSTANSR